MKTPITFLNPLAFRVLKVIRVDGPEWNRFTGFIAYIRRFTRDYQSEKKDYVDDLIFETIRQIYPTAYLYINKDILFEGEKEDLLKYYQGGTLIDFTIRFSPSIPFELVESLAGKEFFEYHPKFEFHLYLNPDDTKIQHINNFAIAYIPFDKLEDFHEKIHLFDFQ